MTGAEEDEANEGLTYWISLQVRHPNLHPSAITAGLGMNPEHSWFVGEPRMTPKRTPLQGYRKDSYWVVSERVTGHRFFFEQVISLIRLLEVSKRFISELMAAGGTMCLNIGLCGSANIGDVIRSADLRRLCDLGIDLSVEVFP